MATKISLNDAISIVDKDLSDIFSKDFREELDKRITILDLSYEALKVNVYRNTKAHVEAYNNAYRVLVEILDEKATRKYTSLKDIPVGYFDNPTAPFLYINGGDSNRFLVARSFEAIRNFVTKYVSKDPRLEKTSFGQSTIITEELNKKGIPSGSYKKTSRTKVDIGHIPTIDNENLVSPLELKFASILELGIQRNNPIIVQEAKKALVDLYAIQAEASYSFTNTTPEAIQLARDVLGEFYVVVTLHRQKLNAAFSTKELAIFNRLKSTLALKLSKVPFEKIEGSNTIIEDIVEAFANTLSGSSSKLKKHNTHKVQKKHKASGTLTDTAAVIKSNKAPPIRNIKGQFTSLISLQTLINNSLQEQIRRNMGTGERRDVLNYRSGRFAGSAEVNRMSQSKEGMITAFYSYMRNPYGSFSDGGMQQYPRSRDPKLLISKSIREIAAKIVGNRMRAVLS